MKDSFIKIRKMVSAVNYIPMAIFILATSRKIKNMAKGLFIGLVCVRLLVPKKPQQR